jgi:hypothetical protein
LTYLLVRVLRDEWERLAFDVVVALNRKTASNLNFRTKLHFGGTVTELLTYSNVWTMKSLEAGGVFRL